MRFIELHNAVDGKPFLVNVYRIELIREVQESDYAYSSIELSDNTVNCRETSHEIMLKIRG